MNYSRATRRPPPLSNLLTNKEEAKAQLDQTRQQLTESDQLIAEANSESIKPLGRAPAGRYTTGAAIMRYNGVGSWAIAEASNVEGFFASKFGRPLPISAFGQSATHNRLGFDHRNSVDVAVHPDSAEGKALIYYLRTNGIPFLAFRSAIAGVATGRPHSYRISVTQDQLKKEVSSFWFLGFWFLLPKFRVWSNGRLFPVAIVFCGRRLIR